VYRSTHPRRKNAADLTGSRISPAAALWRHAIGNCEA
jgi:hypothetical protein